MVTIYMMSTNEGYRERVLEIADGFISKEREDFLDCIPNLMKNYRSVIIVDDDRDFARMLKRSAEGANPEIVVDTYSSPLEALRNYNRPEMLLTDIDMPDMNGFDFVKAVRELESKKASE